MRYIVYDDGRIWSVYYSKWMKADTDKDGYKIIELAGKKYKVHRVVLRAFKRPPREGEVARHKNGKTNDNRLTNLQWGTTSDNERDKWRHGTHNKGSQHGRARLTESIVLRLRKHLPSKNRAAFYRKHAEIYGVGFGTVAHACERRTWKHI